MNRSNYDDDLDEATINLYRGNVDRALAGKRGQRFLRDLANAMDAMEPKELIDQEMQDDMGRMCATGIALQYRGFNPRTHSSDPDRISDTLGIAHCLAVETLYINDEAYHHRVRLSDYGKPETPAQRWTRVRAWVDEHLMEPAT